MYRNVSSTVYRHLSDLVSVYSNLPDKRGGPNKRGDGKNQQNQ